jgi:Flp pilus assembly protein TadG
MVAFFRRENGSMTIFGVFILVCMLMVAGIGVDIMRFEQQRAHVQSTLDRAVLAAADMDQTLAPDAVVRDYFDKANLLNVLSEVSVSSTLGSRTVSASADKDIGTHFMHLAGVDSLSLSASSTALESIPNVEISLVLDISGSMRYSNRMTELKPAAKNFISKVLGESNNVGDGTDTLTTVNVIPYAGQTNPGKAMFEYLGGVRFEATQSPDNYFPAHSATISNVVFNFDLLDDDNDPFDFRVKVRGFPNADSPKHLGTDLDSMYEALKHHIHRNVPEISSSDKVMGVSIRSSANTTYPRTYYPVDDPREDGPIQHGNNTVDLVLEYNDFWDQKLQNTSSCLEMYNGDFNHSMLPSSSSEQVGTFMKWDIASSVMDWGWCPEDDTAIQYAQMSESKLHEFIDSIRMHDGTGTFYGMKYALALLDPTSSDAFLHLNSLGLVPDGIADRPAAYEAADTAKYIVLMTDGQITDQFRPNDKLNPIHGTSEFNNQSGSPEYKSSSRNTNLSWFYSQCDLAKSKGVVVYTIAFDAPSGATVEMRNCASSPSHFFEVDNGRLDDAFTAIASQINKLRLTQ